MKHADGRPEMEKRSAEDIIRKLNLTPHVEKGWYIQTYEDDRKTGDRSHGTAIYYLLEGSVGASNWHRVDAIEVWHFYAGAPLRLELSYNDGTKTESRILGRDIFADQAPQIVIEVSLHLRCN